MVELPFDVFVPSKGRPNGTTFELLKRYHIPFSVVIEKEDTDAYTNVANWFVILPQSNKGIGYCRAYILEHAQRPFVMMDDDITRVCKRNHQHTGIKDVDLKAMLMCGWKHMCKQQAGILGFKHGTFAIPKNSISRNAIVAHILFIDPNVLRPAQVHYDRRLKVFEDIDILFQCYKKNVPFIRCNSFVYFTTPSGTAKKGGVSYTENIKKRVLVVMERRYPGWIKATGDVTLHNQPKYIIHIPK